MKERVKESFSRAAKEYERRALFQKVAGKELIKRLKAVGSPTPLLDLGCGSGYLIPEGGVGVDIAPGMVTQAKRKGKVVVCGDAEELPFKENSFKTVISNFSLQWINLKRAFKEVERVLRWKGFFIGTLPVEGSLETLFRCWRECGSALPLFKFPKEEEVFSALKERFKVVEFKRLYLKREFKSPKEALKTITGIGARNPYGRAKKSEVLRFRELYRESPVVEYRVFIFTAVKA
ncbi:methyltransferase domain-containing protein [Thermovibrio sp.]